MLSTATLRTSVGSFAAHDEPALTAVRGYDVSSRETTQVVRPLPQLGGMLLRTAVAATLAVGIVGKPVEARTWSRDFSADQGIGALHQSDPRSILSLEIMAYRHLPDDWDGAGGVAPSKEAIDDALAFIDLLPLRAKLPKPTVSGDGEVGFYWKTGNGYINVSFFGDGEITYYGRAVSNDMEVGGVKPYNRTSLPKDLLEIVDRA